MSFEAQPHTLESCSAGLHWESTEILAPLWKPGPHTSHNPGGCLLVSQARLAGLRLTLLERDGESRSRWAESWPLRWSWPRNTSVVFVFFSKTLQIHEWSMALFSPCEHLFNANGQSWHYVPLKHLPTSWESPRPFVCNSPFSCPCSAKYSQHLTISHIGCTDKMLFGFMLGLLHAIAGVCAERVYLVRGISTREITISWQCLSEEQFLLRS